MINILPKVSPFMESSTQTKRETETKAESQSEARLVKQRMS